MACSDSDSPCRAVARFGVWDRLAPPRQFLIRRLLPMPSGHSAFGGGCLELCSGSRAGWAKNPIHRIHSPLCRPAGSRPSPARIDTAHPTKP